MEKGDFEKLFGERWPLLFAPFEDVRKRYPELTDNQFKLDVAAPIIGKLSDEFTWLASKRLGLPPPEPHDWKL